MPTTDTSSSDDISGIPASRKRRVVGRLLLLSIGAFAFVFPFYYMFIGSLQEEADPGIGGALPRASNLTTANYTDINEAINLVGSLRNSAIVTIGVLLGTIFFGLLAGYAMAVLHYRGVASRSPAWSGADVPFQLLMIPLYVLLVHATAWGDSYLGMILPFVINPAAVFIFRQFFLQLPRELFDAARIDGAGELGILWRVAIPLARPAILTATLLTFIGPWNDFLWPFLITKRADMQPLAVSLANYISNLQATVSNPFGSVMAGACVLVAPVVGLFIVFQRHFTSSDIGSGVKGDPVSLDALGMVMAPTWTTRSKPRACSPAGSHQRRPLCTSCQSRRRWQRVPCRPRRGRDRRRCTRGCQPTPASCSNRSCRGAWRRSCRVEDPRVTFVERPRHAP